jgi:hypothetical protein
MLQKQFLLRNHKDVEEPGNALQRNSDDSAKYYAFCLICNEHVLCPNAFCYILGDQAPPTPREEGGQVGRARSAGHLRHERDEQASGAWYWRQF